MKHCNGTSPYISYLQNFSSMSLPLKKKKLHLVPEFPIATFDYRRRKTIQYLINHYEYYSPFLTIINRLFTHY